MTQRLVLSDFTKPSPQFFSPKVSIFSVGSFTGFKLLVALFLSCFYTAGQAQPIVDLLTLYTPQALADAGNPQAMHALIQQAVREGNEALANSEIDARVRLIHIAPVHEEERGNTSADLNRLKDPADGFFDNAQTMRDNLGADLVNLILSAPDSSGTGRATQLSSFSVFSSTPRDELVYSVVLRRALIGVYTLIHELGHNLGAQHTASDQGSPGLFDFSNGWRFSADGSTYRTVMARQFGTKIPYFSNPNVLFNGVPTGSLDETEGLADNASTIEQSAVEVAAYRPTKISNDQFTKAEQLEGFWASATGSNQNASAEPDEPDHAGSAAQHSVWWQWTSPIEGTIQITTAGTTFPHRLAIYAGGATLESLIPLKAETHSIPNENLTTTLTVRRDQLFSFAIDSLDGAQGFVALQLSKDNDDFADRIRLTGHQMTSTALTLDATSEPREPAHGNAGGFFGGSRSVWWEWEAPGSGTATVTTRGTSYTTTLGVYQGDDVQNLDLVAEENFTGSNGDWRTVTFEATQGQRYPIAIASAGGLGATSGMAILHVDLAPSEELRFTSITAQPDQSVILTVEGFQSTNFSLEGSEDLQSWEPIESYSPEALPLTVTLPASTSLRQRFFRIQSSVTGE